MSKRTTIVTGAAHGIGRACALRQAALGDAVVLWDLDADALTTVAEEIAAAGGQARAATVDVGDTAAVAKAVAEAADGGELNLAHAAGLMRTIPFEEIDEAEFDRVTRVNLRGTFFVVKALAEAARRGAGGAIVLFSSIAGRKGRPLAAHYAASKAATISIAQSAALRFGPQVRVNAVCPGVIDTPMNHQIAAERHELTGSAVDDPYPGLEETLALKRFGEPDDVARVVEFLLGDLSRYVTGQAINVDGGLEFD
ncbi:MAG TPA: SDR family oxidoreductase [Solirubrobacterales bacterium]|nr:SDR family oxidoreductase [Solirubrobacterales bacterium]